MTTRPSPTSRRLDRFLWCLTPRDDGCLGVGGVEGGGKVGHASASAAGTVMNWSAAVVFHHFSKARFEHGSTSRFSAAKVR